MYAQRCSRKHDSAAQGLQAQNSINMPLIFRRLSHPHMSRLSPAATQIQFAGATTTPGIVRVSHARAFDAVGTTEFEHIADAPLTVGCASGQPLRSGAKPLCSSRKSTNADLAGDH